MADTLHINVPSVTMLETGSAEAEPSNELLYGEGVEVLDGDAFVHVRARHDGYEGYIPRDVLATHKEKTHKVNALSTHIYDAPDFKTSPRQVLYFLSQVHVTGEAQNGFVRLANGGWVYNTHLCPIETVAADFVETALRFEGTPYIWGGRSAGGIDCSGLVQIALMAGGIKAPRDTKDQITALGENVQRDGAQRGDLVFFDRHVGIMVDEENLLNATARHMRTLIEPLEQVEKAYNGITAIKRL